LLRSRGQKKKERIDPYAPRDSLSLFVADVQPGSRRRKTPKSTQVEKPSRKSERAPVRLVEEPKRSPYQEHNVMYILRQTDSVVPNMVYYEDRNYFLIYDARPEAKNRVLIYPKRLIPFPEDINVPNIPVMTKMVERIADASAYLSKNPRNRETSIAYLVQTDKYPEPKPLRVHVGLQSTFGSKVDANSVLEWLLRNKRMSIDSHRCLKSFIRNYNDYYRYGTRFELLPKYEPVPSPEDDEEAHSIADTA